MVLVVVDPMSFVIGGLGAVIVGSIRDESNFGSNPDGSDIALYTNSGKRIFSFPIHSLTRFIVGGCIYVAVDTLAVNLRGHRYPFLSAAVTGLSFATGARTSIFLGSTFGMSLVAEVSERLRSGPNNKYCCKANLPYTYKL